MSRRGLSGRFQIHLQCLVAIALVPGLQGCTHQHQPESATSEWALGAPILALSTPCESQQALAVGANGRVLQVDLGQGSSSFSDSLSEQLTAAAISTSGTYVAYATSAGGLTVVNLGNHKRVLHLPFGMDMITAVSFSNNDKYLALGELDDCITLIDLPERRISWSLQAFHNPIASDPSGILSLSFARDSSRLLAASATAQFAIFQVAECHEMEHFRYATYLERERPLCAIWSEDDKSFYASDSKPEIREWGGHGSRTLSSMKNQLVTAMSNSKVPGQLFAGTASGELWRFTITLGNWERIRQVDSEIDVISETSDGRFLVFGSHDGMVRSIRLSSGR